MKKRNHKHSPSPEDYEPLQSAIRARRQLLLRYGEDSWAEQFDEEVSTVRGVKEILGLHWPGMGGLHDLVICRANGHRISPNREAEVNQRLHGLFDVVLKECYRLRRLE